MGIPRPVEWGRGKFYMKQFYVYIMTNKRKNVLYIGVTSNLQKRISEHKKKLNPGFTFRYNINALIYYEEYQYINDAIAKEKQLKGWRREWKEVLVSKMNPHWQDLSFDWY